MFNWSATNMLHELTHLLSFLLQKCCNIFLHLIYTNDTVKIQWIFMFVFQCRIKKSIIFILQCQTNSHAKRTLQSADKTRDT